MHCRYFQRVRSFGFARHRLVVVCNQRGTSVIFLPAHPASFTHNFVSGMQSFYFSESQGAIVLQTYNVKCSGLI